MLDVLLECYIGFYHCFGLSNIMSILSTLYNIHQTKLWHMVSIRPRLHLGKN